MDVKEPEVILNLWYVFDELGFINKLLGRMYIGFGKDEDKLNFLHNFCCTDYLIANSYQIPERYWTNFVEFPDRDNRLPLIHLNNVPHLGGFMVLFEDVFQDLNSQLDIDFNLSISKQPLVCITPLRIDKDGAISIAYTKRKNSVD